MKRLDVFRLPAEPAKGPLPYVLLLQTERTSSLPTVIVAPVARISGPPIETDIRLLIDEAEFFVRVHELATVRRKRLGDFICSAEHLEWEIGRALDTLLFGP